MLTQGGTGRIGLLPIVPGFSPGLPVDPPVRRMAEIKKRGLPRYPGLWRRERNNKSECRESGRLQPISPEAAFCIHCRYSPT
ncbi:BQ5605_C018g08680 [Microbotryum silenes-dioicae]|uniref:BQ5605_C018g08680 protein n=1 Tax=Microbotryum silenes-dioicae TaxID=796604 RepID=A0A2X0LWP5_9BASI|nr:BQ5605_C018g08680 [Microbotryum silenes-dioicae]